jgi:hypothetical protein
VWRSSPIVQKVIYDDAPFIKIGNFAAGSSANAAPAGVDPAPGRISGTLRSRSKIADNSRL